MRLKYFAYGSNMSPAVFSEICPNHHFLSRARLRGYRMVFSRRSVRSGFGVADVVPTDGVAVWGVLYQIEEDELPFLDRKEGCPKAYGRIDVTVTVREGLIEEAFTYTVTSKEEKEIPPSEDYLNLLVEGAIARKLPQSYVRFLQSLKDRDRYQHCGDFLIIGTKSREEAEGMPLMKINPSVSESLGLGSIAAIVYRGKACFAKVGYLESLNDHTCQVDHNLRHNLGMPGHEAYGTFVRIRPVKNKPAIFPFVRPRSLVLPLHRPSWLDSERNICVLHPNNIRTLGLKEGEYLVAHSTVLNEKGQYCIRKTTVRVFGGSALEIARAGGTTEYPKIDEAYLDLDLRNTLGIDSEAYNIPIVLSPAVCRLFTSRLLYYGITLFLAMVALTPLLQEAMSILGFPRIAAFALTIAISMLVTLVLCLFDIRGRLQY